MNFNILDLAFVILVAIGFLVGFKRGIIKQSVITAGTLIVVILSFLLKNPLSIMLYKKLPFFAIGLLKDYSVLNILLYELLSFLILLTIFSLILAIIIKISGFVERVVRATVILALPSKLLGALLGALEFYVFGFIILLILSIPVFSISQSKFVTDSSLRTGILNHTPIISGSTRGTINSINKLEKIIRKNEKLKSEEVNCNALKIFKDNKIVSDESIEYLIKNKKISNKCKLN